MWRRRRLTLSPPEVLCACPLFRMGGDKKDAPSNPSCGSPGSSPTHCSLLVLFLHPPSSEKKNPVQPTCLFYRSIHNTYMSHVHSCNHDQVWCNSGAGERLASMERVGNSIRLSTPPFHCFVCLPTTLPSSSVLPAWNWLCCVGLVNLCRLDPLSQLGCCDTPEVSKEKKAGPHLVWGPNFHSAVCCGNVTMFCDYSRVICIV